MRKYIKKPSGYFWRVRKKFMNLPQGAEITLSVYPERVQTYIIKLAFSDLKLINIKK